MAKISNVRRVYVRKAESDFCDIDVDLAANPTTGKDRHAIFDFLQKKYNTPGNDHVGLVGVRTVYSIKSALRDICRTYEIPAQETFAVTKEIDENRTLEENVKRNKVLSAFVEKYPEAFKIASQIVGVTSNFGVHAGGVIISDKHYPLNKTVPLQRSHSGLPSTLYDKDELQNYCGFIKYDILQVTALSQIMKVKNLLNDKGIYEDYTETPEPFQLCKLGHHKNIFQFESQLGKRCFKELRMESIYDLSNASGMIRQMGSADGRAMYDKYKRNSTGTETEWKDFLQQEVSKETFDIVEPILRRTYGVLIYQEQLAEMVERMSNGKYSFADGNAVRKKLGKLVGKYGLIDSFQGKRDVLKSWHADVMDTLNKHIIPYLSKDDLEIPRVQEFINFQLDDKGHLPIPESGIINWFIIGATYLFSIIHSVAYSVNSFNQMYQKWFHPVEFWLAALHCGSKDDISSYVSSAISESNLKFLAPEINTSLFSFTNEGGSIRFGLGFIAGMDKAANDIISERNKNGVFTSFEDFLDRTKQYRSVNKKTIENLIFGNALPWAKQEFLYVAWKKVVDDLEWDDKSIRKREKEALSVNISFGNKSKQSLEGTVSIENIRDGGSDKCSFRIAKIQQKKTKTGKPYTMISVIDLNSDSKHNIFIWSQGMRLEEDEDYVAYIKKNGDFYSWDFSRR